MADIQRISATDAHARTQGGEALLVCAYDDPSKFGTMRLEGAISLRELEAMAPTLDKGRELIFYCA